MNISVVIATCGDQEWGDLAWSRAYPSVAGQVALADELIVEHYPELSVSQARNAAAKRARCPWLCFLDADDELASGYIAAIKKAGMSPAQSARPPLFVPNVQYVHPTHVDPPRCLDVGRPLWEINWAVVGTIIYRPMFATAGGFPDEPIYEDWALWLKCVYELGSPLMSVPDAVYRAYVGQGSRNSGVDASEVYTRYRRQYEGREA